jgi:DNA-binding protein HU-beta
MNKSELVDAIASESGLSKKESKAALESIVSTIGNALAEGDKISLVGFGTFSVKKREAREGRNPSNGETIQIPEKNVVKFKVGKALADSVK